MGEGRRDGGHRRDAGERGGGGDGTGVGVDPWAECSEEPGAAELPSEPPAFEAACAETFAARASSSAAIGNVAGSLRDFGAVKALNANHWVYRYNRAVLLSMHGEPPDYVGAERYLSRELASARLGEHGEAATAKAKRSAATRSSLTSIVAVG